MSPTVQVLDVMTMPLTGRQVIEASAGTGKTWTLAALYLRLVLGHGRAGPLLPPQILVMTFTEAATAELRKRIRERLAEACACFRAQPLRPPDPFLLDLRADFAPETWATCAHRLDLAAQWMDDAAIFTIHGWSHRMLREHAFESRSLFEQSAVEDGDALRVQVAQDYWRQWFYPLPVATAAVVEQVASDPADLLHKVVERWQAAERTPLDTDPEPTPPWPLLDQAARWQSEMDGLQAAARSAWTPAWRDTIEQAARSKALKGHPANHLPGRLAKMAAWQLGEDIEPSVLARFTAEALAAQWTGAPDLSDLLPLDALAQHLQGRPDVAPPLLDHAAWALRHAYNSSKAQLAQFDFNDLLQRLYHAVRAPDGALALAIRRQYPVALVDEFQDTDPWQYGALECIYAPPAGQGAGATGDAGTLVMIGDPKQAIYSFRGADLATYLRARAGAEGIHTLSGNHRSTPALVDALNHVFLSAERPFGDVDYQPVQAQRQHLPPLLGPGGHALPAMTVWHTDLGEPLGSAAYAQTMADAFASHMAHLLQQGVAQPWEMAVLVRQGGEAARIREALAQHGIKSVYLSERQSVFTTPEAQDLWRLLRAVLAPRRGDLLRAALACRVWGWPLDEVAALQADESRWEDWLERVLAWQTVWRTQGVLPMLHRWLHDTHIPARLLQQDPATGERRLTNLLQIGEWLQQAAAGLHGEAALLRHFENHLREPALAGDAAQLRLESDDELVKVVTMHKSKGLQYPLVFLPFVAGFRAKDTPGTTDDGHEDDEPPVAEDVRLLYVALTRAERGLWLGVAPRAKEFSAKAPQGKSALSRLLGRHSADDLGQCLARWGNHPHITVQALPPAGPVQFSGDVAPVPTWPARVPRRQLHSHWWSASFSALARPAVHAPAGANLAATWAEERWMDAQCDQPTTGPDAAVPPPDGLTRFNAFPAGSRYGTLLHDLLEWQAREGWPLTAVPAAAPEHTTPGGAWSRFVTARSQAVALTEADQTLLHQWLPCILTQAWPLPDSGGTGDDTLSLADLTPEQAWPEMAFTLPTQATPSGLIDRHIQAQLWPGQARMPLAPRTLNGMLTGFMDLVFEHGGRYHVLDYKSNKLPCYAPEDLAGAMLDHRYDVQLTLYLVALHRLLKARLPGYDYDRHVGGAVYLFLRGTDAPGAGAVSVCPPRRLIETLDALFRGERA